MRLRAFLPTFTLRRGAFYGYFHYYPLRGGLLSDHFSEAQDHTNAFYAEGNFSLLYNFVTEVGIHEGTGQQTGTVMVASSEQPLTVIRKV